MNQTKIKTKKNISNVDLAIITAELSKELEDGFIDNVYEINDTLLKIKCRTKSGKRNLILDASKRINFTNYDYPVPSMPTQYCTALRKYMKNRRILKVYQHELDRILIFELFNKEGKPWKFIIELFLGGNFILVDDENRIFMAKRYKIQKDRKLLAKQEYIFPVKKGINFLHMTFEEFRDVLKKSEIDLVRTISRNIGLVGYLAEEVLYRAGIDKGIIAKDLEDELIKKLYNKIIEMKEIIINKTYKARIYADSDGNYIAFEPFEIKKYKDIPNIKEIFYNSYNEAIDEYFAKIDSELLMSSEISLADKALNKIQRIYESQQEQIKASIDKREQHLEIANLIYANAHLIDKLLNVVLNARKKGMDWNEIENRLKLGKEKGIPEALIYDQIFPKEVKISVILDGKKVKLDFRKSAIENANDFYKLAKKDKRRIEGAKEALKKTEKKLKEKQYERELKEKEKVSLVKRPKAKWYEKYRWFISSDGFLIVGGRDASSNEVIVKKYLDKNDLYFHTEMRGAPSVILKNPEKKEIPETTIKEAAIFAASYSNAWREGYGSAEIFYAYPEQVTKTPNPGEYLTKGSFFIKGKKHYTEKPFLELSIGLRLEPMTETGAEDSEDSEDSDENNAPENQDALKDSEENSNSNSDENISYFPRIIAGPTSAIKKQTNIYVRIMPQKSGLGGGKLMDMIKNELIKQTPEKLKKWAKLISKNDIMHFLPPGNSQISKKK
ncbi:MAG: ribosome rescue protein RqcH [Promethearchaeota archaeon]